MKKIILFLNALLISVIAFSFNNDVTNYNEFDEVSLNDNL